MSSVNAAAGLATLQVNLRDEAESDPAQDWLWNLFYDGLNVTSMSVCRHIFFTGRACAVPAFVSLDALEAMAQHLTVGATLVGTADGCLGNGRDTSRTGMRLVVQEAVGAEKEALAVST